MALRMRGRDPSIVAGADRIELSGGEAQEAAREKLLNVVAHHDVTGRGYFAAALFTCNSITLVSTPA